jgi:hypothetical protein
MTFTRAFHHIIFQIPSEGALPPGSLHKASIEREREREALCFQSPLLMSLKVPSKRTSPLGSPVGSLWREMPVSRAFLYISFRAPSKRALPLGASYRVPIERERDYF